MNKVIKILSSIVVLVAGILLLLGVVLNSSPMIGAGTGFYGGVIINLIWNKKDTDE